jgi:hypothetical protein
MPQKAPPGFVSRTIGRSFAVSDYDPIRATVSPIHSVLVRADENGGYRIQLTRTNTPEPFAPPGHGKVVRELCTFSVETAEETALKLAKSKDPEGYCRSLIRPGNTDGLKITLDQAIGALAPIWLTYPHFYPGWVFHAARAVAIAFGVSIL